MSPQHQGKFVAYFRVSTDKQGKSGLSLEAQRKAVLDYLNGGSWKLIEEFVEREQQTCRPTAARGSARGLQEAQGEAGYRQTRPIVPQSGLHCRADGVGRRVHRRG